MMSAIEDITDLVWQKNFNSVPIIITTAIKWQNLEENSLKLYKRMFEMFAYFLKQPLTLLRTANVSVEFF